MKSCYKCGSQWLRIGTPGFNDVCDDCQSYWHACMNCEFFEEGRANHCRSHTSEFVRAPEGRNTCEEFGMRVPPGGAPSRDAVDPRSKWDELF